MNPYSNCTITVTESVTAGLIRYSAALQRRLTSTMEKGANAIQTRAQAILVFKTGKDAPGGRDTGHLARSITHNITSSPTSIEAIIGVGVEYGKYVEDAPGARLHPLKRHFVPFTTAPGLLGWVLRHIPEAKLYYHEERGTYRGHYRGRGTSLQGLKVKGWMVGGPGSVTPFLRPAFEAEVPGIIAQLQADTAMAA